MAESRALPDLRPVTERYHGIAQPSSSSWPPRASTSKPGRCPTRCCEASGTAGDLREGVRRDLREPLVRALVEHLRRFGFRARAYGYWSGANGKPAIRAANRALTALSPLTIPTAKAFRIVARKPGAQPAGLLSADDRARGGAPQHV